MTVKELSLDEALQVLSFPKLLGEHPTTKAPITVHDGKFGPYVLMQADGVKETRSLTDREKMRTLTLEEAVALLAQPRQRGGRQIVQQAPLATMGNSPVTGQPVVARMGRFGAYVTDGVVNATIPASRDPAKLSMEDALELIAQREQKLREQGIDPRAGGKPPKRGKAPRPAKAAAKAKGTPPKKVAEPPAKKPPSKKAKPQKAAKKAASSTKKPAPAAKKKKRKR
jgi:DNA topoisomerase-1